ncbi:radical SAM protein [Paenibacillus athensensis]|uniref:B12-binding domain-containing radical SAM protein n=1 Tax=Paenibacillus athensensis TaxID=1967502 RepID=UPI00142FA7EA|nr:radical SAM protein [Paenibacillus athensensis]MCD1257715.1 radical SAM protein [Paenibacillus athensensis]
MHIVHLSAPGRFPTVIHDPGMWRHLLDTTPHKVERCNINPRWWEVILDPTTNTWLGVCDEQLSASAREAATALADLCDSRVYKEFIDYRQAVHAVVRHLELLQQAQPELIFNLIAGAIVYDVNYHDSRSLVEYAYRQTVLSRSIELALDIVPAKFDALLVSVASSEELLNALICVRLLKERVPGLYACLIDHGYENYSLHAHMASLQRSGQLERLFDSVIASRDDRDVLVPLLVEELAQGRRASGYLTRADLADADYKLSPKRYAAPERTRLFSPEPVLWTRISERRCYWSKCTFCTQNAKYESSLVPLRSEVEPAVQRLAAYVEAGYETFIFADEALSPAMLRTLCEVLIERKLRIRWACRSKLELAHTRELFELLREAGCYEVLFGLESIVPRIQKLMDKYTPGLDEAAVRRILGYARDAGVGLHMNLIGGFPGEQLEELETSVEFLISAVREIDNVTFLLNRFTVFPDTPVQRQPAAFGLRLHPPEGDMPSYYPYSFAEEIAEASLRTHRAIEDYTAVLLNELGWLRFGAGGGMDPTVYLYFATGHGAILKKQAGHFFQNPAQALQP